MRYIALVVLALMLAACGGLWTALERGTLVPSPRDAVALVRLQQQLAREDRDRTPSRTRRAVEARCQGAAVVRPPPPGQPLAGFRRRPAVQRGATVSMRRSAAY
jgi:hypothetical protein